MNIFQFAILMSGVKQGRFRTDMPTGPTTPFLSVATDKRENQFLFYLAKGCISFFAPLQFFDGKMESTIFPRSSNDY